MNNLLLKAAEVVNPVLTVGSSDNDIDKTLLVEPPSQFYYIL